MAHNIVETATYDAVVPVPDDGDPRTAASVNGALQALADRAAFLNAIVGATGTGAKKIRTVNGTAALKALVGMADGEIAVTNGGFPYASLIWIYSAAGADTEFIPWVVAPTVGGGRWYNTLQAYVNQAGGASGTAARWTLPVANALVGVTRTSNAGTTYNQTPLGTWVDSGFISTPISIQSGDIIEVEYTGTLSNNTTNVLSAQAQLAGFDGAATAQYAETKVTLTPNGGANTIGVATVCLKTTQVFGVAVAAWQAKVQLNAPNIAGGAVGIQPSHNMIVKQYRP